MIEELHLLAHPPPPERRTRGIRSVAKIAVILITMVSLAGMGEAIFASPVLLPALWWANEQARTRVGRVGIAFLAGLVVAEIVWLFVYGSIGEREPYIWLGPLLAFAATVTLFVRHGLSRQRRSRHEDTSGGSAHEHALTAE